MVVQCDRCRRMYNDARAWTICPHHALEDPHTGPLPFATASAADAMTRDVLENAPAVDWQYMPFVDGMPVSTMTDRENLMRRMVEQFRVPVEVLRPGVTADEVGILPHGTPPVEQWPRPGSWWWNPTGNARQVRFIARMSSCCHNGETVPVPMVVFWNPEQANGSLGVQIWCWPVATFLASYKPKAV